MLCITPTLNSLPDNHISSVLHTAQGLTQEESYKGSRGCAPRAQPAQHGGKGGGRLPCATRRVGPTALYITLATLGSSMLSLPTPSGWYLRIISCICW